MMQVQGDARHALIVDRSRGRSWWDALTQSVILGRDWTLSVLTDRDVPPEAEEAPNVALLKVRDLSDNLIAGVADDLHVSHPLSGASTTSELLLASVAEVRGRLSLPGPSVAQVRSVRDKWRMKQLAQGAGLRAARGTLATDRMAAGQLLETAGAVVAKPRAGSGSRGVSVLRSRRELDEWFASVERLNEYLLEEYVAGPMVHIDGFMHAGHVVHQVSRYVRPTIECGGPTPLSSRTVQSPRLIAAAGRLAKRVADAWGIRADVFHLEAFLVQGRLWFCELAARPGGGGVADAFRATRGYDLHRLKTLFDLGLPPPSPAVNLRAHAGWTVHYSPGGRFVGLDDAAMASAAVARRMRASIGEDVPRSTFSGAGLVTYTFADDSADRVRDMVESCERTVTVHFE